LPEGAARFQRQSGECSAHQSRASAQQFSAIHLLHDFSFWCGWHAFSRTSIQVAVTVGGL
jgi:hypothetical protein